MTRDEATAVYTAAARIHASFPRGSKRIPVRKIRADAKSIAVAMEAYIGQLGRMPARDWR